MRGLAGNLLLLAGGLLVAGVLSEALARIVLGPVPRGNATPVPATLVRESSVAGLRYELRPSASAVHRFPDDPRGYFDPDASLTYRTNALGFRGPETTLEKESGSFRILGIGDSFTFGTGVRAEDTFLAVAEEELNGAADGTIEILNLGVMGYDTPEEVVLLRSRGLDLAPDLVVICFFLNDSGGGPSHQMAEPLTARWWHRSVLADQVSFRLGQRERAARLVERYQHSFHPGAPGWRAARRSLRAARDLSEERGFALAVAIFPVLWDLSGDYPFRAIHEEVTEFARGLGLPVLDLLPAFAGADGPELWVHPTNQHPNEAAHRLAGAALAGFLRQHGLVPDRS